MTTTHQIHPGTAIDKHRLAPSSVHLLVTSPPYPMVEMWDAAFAAQEPDIGAALARSDGWSAFRQMHALLDPAWEQAHRVLVDGGIACINIGDATRTVGESFTLYPNHARILTQLLAVGFSPLPEILWRKQTNAPNKFMGSGMLPPGAYVTLEHEHILIVRKGGKREFLTSESKAARRQSAYFWEERNQWFSDVWMDLKGTRQDLPESAARERSAAFPFELPYRLINMFSVEGDTVLDPFLGTGTTMLAAMATARNSVGFELDAEVAQACNAQVETLTRIANDRLDARLQAHAEFVKERRAARGSFGYSNPAHEVTVMTRQEIALTLPRVQAVRRLEPWRFEVDYEASPRLFAAASPDSLPVTQAHKKL